MQVIETVSLGGTFEIGNCSWNGCDISIRSRHDLPSGKFTPYNSPEVPSYELPAMVAAALRSKVMPVQVKRSILAEVAQWIAESQPH